MSKSELENGGRQHPLQNHSHLLLDRITVVSLCAATTSADVCTSPPRLHLSLRCSLEGILKYPGQTLGNLQVKPCETPRDTQHTMYSSATLFISLPQVPQQRESTEYWSRNSLTVVTASVFDVVSGFFYFHPQCQGRRHLRFT